VEVGPGVGVIAEEEASREGSIVDELREASEERIRVIDLLPVAMVVAYNSSKSSVNSRAL
jgi:hypothetical protein